MQARKSLIIHRILVRQEALLHRAPPTTRPPTTRPPTTSNKAPHNRNPWADERGRSGSAETFYAQLGGAKTGHALESTTSKFGSILALLLISSVAAVGVFMSEEDKTVSGSHPFSTTSQAPRDAEKQAY